MNTILSIVFWEGKFIPEAEAFVPITDRGFLYGEGVFTTLKVNHGRIEAYEAHLQRLKLHTESLMLKLPVLEVDSLKDMVLFNHALQGAWRLKILFTSGSNRSDLEFQCHQPGGLLMTLEPFINPFSINHPVKLGIYEFPIVKPLSRIKTLAYLDRLLIKKAAKRVNCDDCVTMTESGILLETGFSNLFWIDSKIVYLPEAELPYLQGISLRFCLKVLQEMGFAIHYCKPNLKMIQNFSHCFVCNSLMGPQPVSKIGIFSYKLDERLVSVFQNRYQVLMDKHSLLVK